jgi:hypothetical protein
MAARIAFSSPLVPGLVWEKPICRFWPSPDQKLSFDGGGRFWGKLSRQVE